VPAVDLNADLGESDELTEQERSILGTVTSASISCGAHAGTLEGIRATVDAAVRAGVVIGAHPSYPDRPGAGRRDFDLSASALAESLAAQVAVVADLALAAGSAVRFVKPHGALYNRLTVDGELGRVVAEVVRSAGDLVLLLQAGAAALPEAQRLGVVCVTEAFADRAYRPDGTLVPRTEPGAVLVDAGAVLSQARSIVLEGRAPASDGGWVQVRASSLCVHGDTPGAAALASDVRRTLEEAGVRLAPFVR
jgi:UPF0271 protein